MRDSFLETSSSLERMNGLETMGVCYIFKPGRIGGVVLVGGLLRDKDSSGCRYRVA
jgi:hypothetical protein